MGILSAFTGNASAVDQTKLQEQIGPLLVVGEQVEQAFQLVRDQIVFTNRRLILINKQGVTGRKQELVSVPYKSITMFLVEQAGTLDLDAEVKLWVRGLDEPMVLTFGRGTDLRRIGKVLAEAVCKALMPARLPARINSGLPRATRATRLVKNLLAGPNKFWPTRGDARYAAFEITCLPARLYSGLPGATRATRLWVLWGDGLPARLPARIKFWPTEGDARYALWVLWGIACRPDYRPE